MSILKKGKYYPAVKEVAKEIKLHAIEYNIFQL